MNQAKIRFSQWLQFKCSNANGSNIAHDIDFLIQNTSTVVNLPDMMPRTLK